ncbi:MAG TPA: methyltransferase domain-containing protein [Alphaproteobacteria bacterium]|jgi:SAM-dependent methyltransferase|nr:methyltransferase domain-containing protein [Alphaproteobacteria bacterium]
MDELDFSRRATTPELMDTEVTGFEEFRDCLVDLEKVNFWTLTYRPMMAFLDRLVADGLVPKNRPLVILDAGSGYGGMLRKIDEWAARRGIAVDLTGIDLNPWAAAAAETVTPPGRPIRWVTSDMFDYRPAGGIDLIVSSQFTHHLDDALLVRFLKWMEDTARVGWFVSDLHRHWLPYHFFRVWSRLMGWHRFVRHDGPVSITRSFVKAEWRRLLAEAGIPEGAARVEWWVPFRLCVARTRRQ